MDMCSQIYMVFLPSELCLWQDSLLDWDPQPLLEEVATVAESMVKQALIKKTTHLSGKNKNNKDSSCQ